MESVLTERKSGKQDNSKVFGNEYLISPSISHRLNPAFRMADHHVHVEIDIRHFRSQAFNERMSKSQIRHKVAIHDIQVEVVGSRVHHAAAFVVKTRQVSVED